MDSKEKMIETFLIKNMGTLEKLSAPIEEALYLSENYEQGSADLYELDFFNIFLLFSNIDGKVDESEVYIANMIEAFIADLKREEYEVFHTPEDCRKFFLEKIKENDNLFMSINKPFTFQYLDFYDKLHNTNYADEIRSVYFQFANLICKIDGHFSSEEIELLKRFKAVMYDEVDYVPLDDLFSIQIPKKSLNSSNSKITDEEKTESLDDLLKELNQLIGLERIKEEVSELINFIKVQKIRESKGLQTQQLSRHLVFVGNPGTGKTTIARLLSRIYKILGVLSLGHLIETDRSGLVAGYVGQTAIKTKEVIERAIGGILFIDEAYTLSSSNSDNDYGKESIDTLLKMMEDNRNDLIVIVAGYPEKMNQFLNSNPGLKSRFNKYLYFDDYTPSQMINIFESFVKNSEYKLTLKAKMDLYKIISIHYDTRDKETFGNARFVRNLFETTLSNQANRIVTMNNFDDDILITIEAEDIPGSLDLKNSVAQ